ncbi:carboxypeptidase-like regulatory domain-containing protein [Leadbetterella sp. DM7]|uniref:carboxypeptidase-like regulatory domain-containing protein n=1 Tax=Leadbetterella sp. DM7 TaxID=3235085 RepID=UPI00349E7FC7
MRSLITTLIILLGFIALAPDAHAQGEQKFITFSGFVIDGSTDEPMVGAYVINQRAGKGVQTNAKGYFILDVFPGDSLVFSFLGFKPQYHIIPRNTGLTYSAVVELNIENKWLKEVKVYPFRTEEEFKMAFLSMDTPNEDERKIIERNLGSSTLRSIAMATPMNAMSNYRYALDQQLNHLQNQKMTTMNPLMNAGTWVNFIRSVKNGSLIKGLSESSTGVPEERDVRSEIFRAGKNNN